MLQFLAGLLVFLSKLADLFMRQKDKEAGRAEERLKQSEAENEAIQTAKDIKADNAKLNVVSITDKLRKYQKD